MTVKVRFIPFNLSEALLIPKTELQNNIKLSNLGIKAAIMKKCIISLWLDWIIIHGSLLLMS